MIYANHTIDSQYQNTFSNKKSGKFRKGKLASPGSLDKQPLTDNVSGFFIVV